MYDKEKGIYPQGQYLTGRDLPLGGYILVPKDGKTGRLIIYQSYDDFINEEDEIRWDDFDDDYHISITKENIFISVENAMIRKIS